LFAALLIVGSDIAAAQEAPPGPGVFEIHLIPGGATLFTETDTAPDFVDYALGGAFTWNPSRIFGIEGEVGGNLGLEQSLGNFRSLTEDESTPNFLSYSGNLVVSLPTGKSVVPYATGGGRSTDDVRAGGARHQRHPDVSHRQRGWGPEVVPEWPLGPARRLSLHAGTR